MIRPMVVVHEQIAAAPVTLERKRAGPRGSARDNSSLDFEQCTLRLRRTLPIPLGLFVLPGQAFPVNGDLGEQIKRVWYEAEFLLRNRQTFSPLHTPSVAKASA